MYVQIQVWRWFQVPIVQFLLKRASPASGEPPWKLAHLYSVQRIIQSTDLWFTNYKPYRRHPLSPRAGPPLVVGAPQIENRYQNHGLRPKSFTCWLLLVDISAMGPSGISFKLLAGFFTVLWGTVTVLRLIWEIVKHPLRSFQRSKRDVPPACLTDPSLGRHEYVTANGIKFHCVTAGERSKPLMLFLHGFPEVCPYLWCYWYAVLVSEVHVYVCTHRVNEPVMKHWVLNWLLGETD